MSRVNALGNIDEAIAYFADRSDVVDGDYGQPAPNAEMNLQRELEEARAAIVELIAAATFARFTGNGPGGYTAGADRRLSSAIVRAGGEL